jgi:hypothetical protein
MYWKCPWCIVLYTTGFLGYYKQDSWTMYILCTAGTHSWFSQLASLFKKLFVRSKLFYVLRSASSSFSLTSSAQSNEVLWSFVFLDGKFVHTMVFFLFVVYQSNGDESAVYFSRERRWKHASLKIDFTFLLFYIGCTCLNIPLYPRSFDIVHSGSEFQCIL